MKWEREIKKSLLDIKKRAKFAIHKQQKLPSPSKKEKSR